MLDSIKKLISLRPTEPALRNALKFAQIYSVKAALSHFEHAKENILKYSQKVDLKGFGF